MATRISVNASERRSRPSRSQKKTLIALIVIFALAILTAVTTDSPRKGPQRAVAQQIE